MSTAYPDTATATTASSPMTTAARGRTRSTIPPGNVTARVVMPTVPRAG